MRDLLSGSEGKETVSVALQFSGVDLDPRRVTKMLGCRPSFGLANGDSVEVGGRKGFVRIGSWTLTAGKACSVSDVSGTIRGLLTRLHATPATVLSLAEAYGGRISCVMNAAARQDFKVKARVRELLKVRGLRVEVAYLNE
jgi:hypothetical protein